MWEVASNQMSFLSLSLFVLARMPNYFLTIKNLGVEQTHRQSSTVKRGGNKLECVINVTSVCAKQTVNAARSQKFRELLLAILSFPASWLKSAVQKSPEGIDYQQAGAGSSPALA